MANFHYLNNTGKSYFTIIPKHFKHCNKNNHNTMNYKTKHYIKRLIVIL